MSEFKPLAWTLDKLCYKLEWTHRNAFAAGIRSQRYVDLGEERETLNKLLEFKKYGDRVKITRCMNYPQQWFNIYIDDIQVADAYIDDLGILSKSWWNIWENAKQLSGC